MNIKISADSTCDLSPELIEPYGIGIAPLYIIDGDQSWQDGVDIHPEDLYEHVRKTGKLYQTAAVNVSDYISFFSEQLKTHDTVITLPSPATCPAATRTPASPRRTSPGKFSL